MEASLGYIARPCLQKTRKKRKFIWKIFVYPSPSTEALFQSTEVFWKKYLFTSSLIVSGSVGETVSWVVKTQVSVREGFMAADSGKPWVGRKKRLNTNTRQGDTPAALQACLQLRSQTVKQPREGLRNVRGVITGHP